MYTIPHSPAVGRAPPNHWYRKKNRIDLQIFCLPIKESASVSNFNSLNQSYILRKTLQWWLPFFFFFGALADEILWTYIYVHNLEPSVILGRCSDKSEKQRLQYIYRTVYLIFHWEFFLLSFYVCLSSFSSFPKWL